jgi:hypothetical protein
MVSANCRNAAEDGSLRARKLEKHEAADQLDRDLDVRVRRKKGKRGKRET